MQAMRLEVAGQDLEAWEALLESSWSHLQGSKASSGKLLGAYWRLLELSWRLLEILGDVPGAPGTILEAS